MTIPQPLNTSKTFYERLGDYEKEVRKINGQKFVFVIEKTNPNCLHACSIKDIEKVLFYIPKKDYGELNLIILRQPKKKEKILSSVWGRLIYSYEFEGQYSPAIVIEAMDYSKKMKWPKKLSPDDQLELKRLREDGHSITEEKRFFVAEHQKENVRNTQLYRTLPHEMGHYVHYLTFVERAGKENEDYEEWLRRNELYFKISEKEKEWFAHKYADKIRRKLIRGSVILLEKRY